MDGREVGRRHPWPATPLLYTRAALLVQTFHECQFDVEIAYKPRILASVVADVAELVVRFKALGRPTSSS